MTGDQIIATAAVAVALVSIIANVLMWLEARRSAEASERSAASSESSAADSRRMARLGLDQYHDYLRPRVPGRVQTDTVEDPNRPGRYMVQALITLEAGEAPPRDYRVSVTGHTLNSTMWLSGAFTMRTGREERYFLGSISPGDPIKIVELSVKFWPNDAVSGDSGLDPWSCPCGLDDQDAGHWRARVPVDFDPSAIGDPRYLH
ncbi:hypothetical protein [Nocardiopsis sp. NPDC057823]|uniref:hypothetical protein n=1 Tax=Nocardiopsis sp. NPDC057823 TaxID=3346256 RepID=UPI00366AA1EC